MTSPDYKEFLALFRSGAVSEAAEKLLELQRGLKDELRSIPGSSGSLDDRSVLELARTCIAAPGEEHVLGMHVFEDEQEEHDDELVDQLTEKFKETLALCVNFLEPEFGSARFVDLLIDPVDEQEADEALNLIEGFLYGAIWTLKNTRLYVAIVQPDREAPLSLVLGAQ